MPLRRLLPCAALALALVPAAPAAADQASPRSAARRPSRATADGRRGRAFDEPTGRYILMLRDPGQRRAKTPLPSSKRPWDVSLGPDAHGNVVAIYQRCGLERLRHPAHERGHRHRAGPQDRLLALLRRGHAGHLALDVVFTRRVKGCDVPYVKNLSSSASSRRLLKSKCLQTDPGHASIRGSRIVISSVDTQRGRQQRRGHQDRRAAQVLEQRRAARR